MSVFQALAELANEQGSCHVQIVQLAINSRRSPSTVSAAIRTLRRERWIVTDRILGRGGVLIFQINLPRLARSRRPLVGSVDLAWPATG